VSKLFTSVYVEMAEAKLAEGELAAAESFYKSALAEDPRELRALLGFARLVAGRPGGYATAEVLVTRACELHPGSPAAHRALADVYHATGRHGLAREEQLKADRLAEGAGERDADASRSGIFDRLKHFGRRGPEATHGGTNGGSTGRLAPASRRGSAPKECDCPYCGNHRRPGARVCGRCGASL
jgi:tetratricopeptide (TPR) repeat protein